MDHPNRAKYGHQKMLVVRIRDYAYLVPYAKRFCPVSDVFAQAYHWSLMQVEYSTDLIFRSEATLATLYEQLSREAVLAVKAEQVASFTEPQREGDRTIKGLNFFERTEPWYDVLSYHGEDT